MKLPLLLLLFATSLSAAEPKFITSDIDRFWRAYDLAAKAATQTERERIYEAEYFGGGSAGLSDYQEMKIGTVAQFAEHVEAHRPYYDGIRAETLRLSERLPAIRASLAKLQELVPDAQLPDVYFVIGRLSSGGTMSKRGLLIGTEMYSVSPGTPLDGLPLGRRRIVGSADALPHTVVHELVHFQQQKAGGKETLLFYALIEGGAELIADLLLPAPRKPFFREWGELHEREVWERFSREKSSEDPSEWIGNNSRATEQWPADLGYFVGYQIARAYYERAADKKQAVRELLTFQDAEAILRTSGYHGGGEDCH